MEASQVCENTAADPKELTVSLNRAMGWPDDTELELVPPDPLVENFSLAEIADKAVAANPDVIVAGAECSESARRIRHLEDGIFPSGCRSGWLYV